MLCDSVSCYVMGCGKIRESLSDHLGIDPGETTADGRFTLLPVVCLGACDHAPVMIVDDQLFQYLKAAELPNILEAFE
ncbi:MAG: NAD(P)H-dependent oxidoreductase subunit E, partial [Pseudomonadales bacterium]